MENLDETQGGGHLFLSVWPHREILRIVLTGHLTAGLLLVELLGVLEKGPELDCSLK